MIFFIEPSLTQTVGVIFVNCFPDVYETEVTSSSITLANTVMELKCRIEQEGYPHSDLVYEWLLNGKNVDKSERYDVTDQRLLKIKVRHG